MNIESTITYRADYKDIWRGLYFGLLFHPWRGWVLGMLLGVWACTAVLNYAALASAAAISGTVLAVMLSLLGVLILWNALAAISLMPLSGAAETCSTSINGRGLSFVTQRRCLDVPWREVTGVRQTTDYLLLSSMACWCCCVPKRAFDTPPEAQAYFETALHYWRASRSTSRFLNSKAGKPDGGVSAGPGQMRFSKTEFSASAYTGEALWTPERPRVLVVCCSDGRLQEAMDEFLQNHLGISDYDRFYAPGGPAALTPGGNEFLRAAQYRDDLAFLVRVHRVEELILIFHGAAPGGPEEAICAYYRRVLPGANAETVREQQGQDLADVRMYLNDMRLTAPMRAYRAEVMANRQVQFMDMG